MLKEWTEQEQKIYDNLPVYFALEIWRRQYESLYEPNSIGMNAAYEHLALLSEHYKS